jgi:flavin-dependent dehydrogenase
LQTHFLRYDVIIAGGGLAGLTLALQLKQTNSSISILVLEKRTKNAPVATHKVGESLSEMGSFYLREIINLKAYLNDHQLKKFGFRFFFSPEHSDDIARRVEVGSKIPSPFPSHQLDRGLLENELVQKLKLYGVEVLLGATITNTELSKEGHIINYTIANNSYYLETGWLVDATGRRGLLKRKLELDKLMDHNINSAWFRLDALIDIDYWSDNLEWRSFVDPGRRRLATNHLMGEGYWVWIIPLVDGKTSVGIVADPVYHPFETYNTFEKAIKWLQKHEPLAAKMLCRHSEKQLDFKVMKHFSYDTKQFYSNDKWALTGEAGAFLDPFYSPGSDFIALGNSWITDLIIRDFNKENIEMRTRIYDLAHKELLSGWLLLYKNMYGLFGKTQVMLMKIIWDWASYWAVPNVMFMNNGYNDIAILKQYSSANEGIGLRFAKLNKCMQDLFKTWGKYKVNKCSDKQFNVFDLKCLHQFQSELGMQYNKDELMLKLESNLKILEQISGQIFRLVSSEINSTPLDLKVDPYTMFLQDGKDELLKKSESDNAIGIDESIKADISHMWFSKTKSIKNEFA